MTRPSLALSVALALAAAGCGSSPLPPVPAVPATPIASAPAPAPKPAAAMPTTATTTGSLVPPSPGVPESTAPLYDPRGRRDPFAEIQTISGSNGLLVATTKLTGIVRSGRTTLALVETAEGIGYIVKPGDTLGDGQLLEIGADSVVFAVTPRSGVTSNRVVLRLAAN